MRTNALATLLAILCLALFAPVRAQTIPTADIPDPLAFVVFHDACDASGITTVELFSDQTTAEAWLNVSGRVASLCGLRVYSLTEGSLELKIVIPGAPSASLDCAGLCDDLPGPVGAVDEVATACRGDSCHCYEAANPLNRPEPYCLAADGITVEPCPAVDPCSRDPAPRFVIVRA